MEDRRSALRRHLPHAVIGRVVDVSEESSQAALLQDISCSGAGLLLVRPIKMPMLLGIELPGRPESILARVVHGNSLEDGTFQAGFQFLDPLDESELAALGL
jgi:hypothetical protein